MMKKSGIICFLVAVIVLGVCALFVTDVEGVNNQYDVPDDVRLACERYGSEYHISPEFLQAVAWVESNYKPNVSNKAGTCHGLMQIKQSAHQSRMNKLGVTSLFDVDGNVHVAADYFSELFEEYEDPAVVLMYYNGDSRAYGFETGQYTSMSQYAQTILDLSRELEERHGKLYVNGVG